MDIYDTMENRVIETLKENGEAVSEDGIPAEEGIAKYIVESLYYGPTLNIDDVYNFAEKYSVSIDWLLGRTDKEWY